MPWFQLYRILVIAALASLGSGQLSAEDTPLRLHVETDRPVYHIGDPVLSRVVAVDALTRAPREGQTLRLQILDPRDNELESLAINPQSGMTGLRWETAALSRGGTYTIRVRAEATGDAEANEQAVWSSRAFHIAGHRQQQVAASITFARNSVAPGETLAFTVDAAPFNQDAPAPRQIRVSAVVDGVSVMDHSWEAGEATSHPASVDIPQVVRLGGSLAVTIDDSQGGSTTVARSLPIAVSGVQVATRIPGGGLVAGLPARVYAQARLPDGRPAHLRARIINVAGESVAELHSEHEGRGRSAFTPEIGGHYRLRIDAPAGMDDIPLPAVLDSGVSLHGGSDAQAANADLHLRVAANPAQTATLELRRAGVLLHRQSVDLSPKGHDLHIADMSADGVLSAHLLSDQGKVLATRRIFRHPAQALTLHWIDRPENLRDGDRATILMEVRNAAGEAVPNALVSLRLRDAGITGLRAQRDRHPSLQSMLLLEQEVAALADPEVYLDGDAAADRRLDLLLSCQGLAVVPAAPVDIEDAPPEGITGLMTDQDLRKGDVASGREQALSASETGGSGAFMAIGAGGGAAGAFGNRAGGGKRRALGIYGGSRASESAVDAALRLFQQVQEPDGRWRVGELAPPASRVGPRLPLPIPAGVGEGRAADLALTALIAQTYLSSGYDHRTPNKYRRTTASALEWLQTHAPVADNPAGGEPDIVLIAKIARTLIEAYAMTHDPSLRQPAQTLLDRLLDEQLEWEGQWLGWGWQETDDDGLSIPVVDAQRSLKVALALSSAQASGLDMGKRQQQPESPPQASPLLGLHEYLKMAVAEGALPQRWSPARDLQAEAAHPSIPLRLAAIVKQLDMVELWAAELSTSNLPEQEVVDLRHRLWASEGLFLLAQDHWHDWNERLRDPLIQRQLRDDQPWDGLWAIDGPVNNQQGPLASTALAANALQVYYRYNPKDGRERLTWAQDPASHPTMIRTYYHGRNRQQRRDATWLWVVARRSDEQGRLSIPMRTIDAHGDWELNADVLDEHGRIGHINDILSIRRPLSLAMRLPQHLVSGDRFDLRLLVRGKPGALVHLEGPFGSRTTLDDQGLSMLGRHLRLVARDSDIHLRIKAQQGQAVDQLHPSIPVVPRDTPWQDALSGHWSANTEESRDLVIPRALSGLSAQLQLPRPLSERAQASHAALIRKPHGCFEQTSATTYPLAVAHAAMRQGNSKPQDMERSLEALTQGYKRLLSFESAEGGFEWFGSGAGHTGLTAFGLLQFHDLNAVGVGVDPQMIARTRDWLLSRIDASSGAVQPSGQPSLHGWDEAGPLLDLYVAWALASSEGTLPPALLGRLKTLDLSGAWQLSLAAETWALLGFPGKARTALAAMSWGNDQLVDEPGNGVIRSNTTSLRVEASARALISGLLLGDDIADWLPVYRALAAKENHGRFGSTQATVQALRALAMIEAQHSNRAIQGTLSLVSNGGDPQDIPVGEGHPSNVTINGLQPGSNQLSARWQGNQPLPWVLNLGGQLEHPDNPAPAPLELAITPLPETVRLGDAVDLQLRVIAHQATPTPMARIGLPAGLLPRPDQLDELVEAGRIAAWEIHGPELVLYWRQLPAGEHRFSIASIADVAGQFRGVASSIQPYYQDDLRHWHPGLPIDISHD